MINDKLYPFEVLLASSFFTKIRRPEAKGGLRGFNNSVVINNVVFSKSNPLYPHFASGRLILVKKGEEKSKKFCCFANTCFIYLLLVIILFLILSSTSFARVDPLQELIANDYPALTLWENVEGKPVWLSGQPLEYSFNFSYKNGYKKAYKAGFNQAIHIVRLKKNESIRLHLNQSELLKIISVDGQIPNTDLTIESSNGTSLYSVLEVQETLDNAVIIDAVDTHNRIIKVSNRADKQQVLSFFISRHDYAKRLIAYRDLLDLPLDSFKLINVNQHEAEKYWLLNKNQHVSLNLTGPISISLQTRLKYPDNFYNDRQKFYLSYSIDNAEPDEFHLSAQRDVSNYYTIDNKSISLAHSEQNYIEIPEGEHELRLKSSESAYIRLLKLDEPDYLFPVLNETSVSIEQARLLYNKTQLKKELKTADPHSILANSELMYNNLNNSFYNMQWIAEFLAANNAIRDSALDAVELLEQSARSSRGLAESNQIAEKFRRQHTFYRHLLPFENDSKEEFSIQNFILYPLRQWNKPPLSHYRAGSFFSTERPTELPIEPSGSPSILCESLNKGYFFTLSDSSSLTYRISERVYDTPLRVLIDKKSLKNNETFYIQFDNNETIQFNVSPASELSVSYFNTTSSEACVSHLIHNAGSDLFNRGHHLTDVAFLEVTLPAATGKITVWKPASAENSSLKIALQYQAAKPYKISQQYYINMIKQFNDNKVLFSDLFLAVIQNKEADTLSKPSSAVLSMEQIYRLTQHWQSLKLFLLSRKNLFVTGYRKPAKKKTAAANKTACASEQCIASLYQKILLKREQNLWVEIIELFSSVQINPEHSHYLELHKEFYYALEQAGESRLRERFLKGALFFNENDSIKQTAFALLKQYYETYQFENKLTQLLITQAYRLKTDSAFRDLALNLARQGYNDYALQIGLLLQQDSPVNQLFNDALLLASLSEKKWTFYAHLLKQNQDSSKQSGWLALKALALGDKIFLKNYLSQENKSASYPPQLIKKVLSVAETMTYSNSQDSAEGRLKQENFIQHFLEQWTQWSYWKLKQKHHRWKNAISLITHAQGSVALYNQERNLLKTYQRADQNSPIKLRLIGPARLRIGVRLLYQDITQERIKTTLRLDDNNKKLFFSLISSVPSQGQIITELPDSVVGSIQYFEYMVGEGEHDIQYYAEQNPIISTLETQQLSFPNPLLPEILTADFFTSELSGEITETSHSKPSASKPSSRECINKACIILSDHHQTESLPRIQLVKEYQYDVSLSDVPLETYSVSYAEDSGDSYAAKTLDINYFRTQFEKLCISNNALSPNGKNRLPFIIETLDELAASPTTQVQCYEESHRIEKALLLLSQMLWYKNHYPEHKAIINVWAGTILQQLDHNPKITMYYSLFEQQYQWSLESSVIESAGLKFSSIRGWQPLTARARIRKALINPQLDSIILSNNYISGISLSNYINSQLEISIKSLGLTFFPHQEVLLRYQLDDQDWEKISIGQDQQEKSLLLPIPTGTHTFKVQWLNPMIGQYVSLNLMNSKYQYDEKLYNEFDRYYHIATADEPVKIAVNGPVRLRVDYLLDEQLKTHGTEYLMIPDGWHKLTLPVLKNKEAVWYRVYLRTFANAPARSQYPPFKKDMSSLPFSRWYKEINHSFEQNMENNVQQNKDSADGLYSNKQVDNKINKDLIPFHQEDGTLAFGILWSQGEHQEEDDNTADNTVNNDYFEYNVSHNLFVEQWNSYFDTLFLYRDHDKGKPSFGFKETIFTQLDWLPFSFRFDWKYFTQKYDSPKGNKTAWSSNIRLGIEQLFDITPKWQHLPRLTVFNKEYHNSDFFSLKKTDIDQDVWSEYGDIHDKGLIISDTLYYKPWLDTQLSSGFSYYSDEDYRLDKPEHASLRFGWLQKLDQFIVDLKYRRIYYFSQQDHNWNRTSSSNKGIIDSNLYWENWNSPHNRFLSYLKMSYDTAEDDFNAGVGFSYYFDQGRGFRDFRPHTQSFRRLRERQRFINNDTMTDHNSTDYKDE